MTSIYDWSLDAASNANSDSIINWAEGQPPSSVNDSARAMMKRIAEYVHDTGGRLEASGSANALALTLNVPIISYHDGIIMRFRAQFTNSGAATITVNNLGVRNVFMMEATGLTALAGGEIQTGGVYDCVYMQSLDQGAGGWLLLNPTYRSLIPSGLIAAFGCDVPPNGWLECDGSEISRVSYANLFAIIGTNWGAGDGSTTFQLPDLRGQFLRGWDHGRGIDSGRAFASTQDSQNKLHNHGGFTSFSGNHSHSYNVPNFTVANVGAGNIVSVTGKVEETRSTAMAGVHQHQILSDGGAEARPRNSTVLYAIKI